MLQEALIFLVSFLALVVAGLLYWNLTLHERLQKLEQWAQKVPGVVEQHTKATARVITEQHLDAQEDKIGRRFKEVDGLLVALSSAIGRTTSQLRQYSEYGAKVSLSEHDTTLHRSIETADTDARQAALPANFVIRDTEYMRECCKCYAHFGPAGSGAGCDDCPPWESVREFCVRLRAANTV